MRLRKIIPCQNTIKIFFTLFIIFQTSLIPCFAKDPSLAKVQIQLKREGHYHGPIDGILGSQTGAAIRRYQLAKHLRVTGELNEETYRALGIPSPK